MKSLNLTEPINDSLWRQRSWLDHRLRDLIWFQVIHQIRIQPDAVVNDFWWQLQFLRFDDEIWS